MRNLLAFAIPLVFVSLPAFGQSSVVNPLADAEFRLVWGGPSPLRLGGTLTIDSGRLELKRNLRLTASAMGSIHEVNSREIRILREESSRFGGLDFQVSGKHSGILTFNLETISPNESPQLHSFTFELADIVRERKIVAIPGTQHSVAIERPLSDRLRLLDDRQNPIFSPSETWAFRVSGSRTGLQPGKYEILLSLESNDGIIQKLPSQACSIDSEGSFPNVPISLEMPDHEGVFHLNVKVQRSGFIEHWLGRTEMARAVELVVVKSNSAQSHTDWVPRLRLPASAAVRQGTLAWMTSALPTDRLRGMAAKLEGFAPGLENLTTDRLVPSVVSPYQSAVTKPSALQRLNPLAGSLHQSKAFGNIGTRSVEIKPTQGDPATNAIQETAVTIGPKSRLLVPLPKPVKLDSPYRIRIRYPVDQIQELAISVCDADNRSESLKPAKAISIGPRETSMFQTDEAELIYWPSQSDCTLVLANPNTETTSSFLDILIDEAVDSKESSHATTDSRATILMLDKPLLSEALNANRSSDMAKKRKFDSWHTWVSAAKHLEFHMNELAANTLILPVISEGGGILPLDSLLPTHRFDSGTFFGDDRSRKLKDFPELLLRQFAGSNKTVFLSIDLNGRLQKLEQALVATPEKLAGLRLRTLSELKPTDTTAWDEPPGSQTLTTSSAIDASDRYNPIHPAFQAEIKRLIREIMNRYKHHPAFGGIIIEVNRDSPMCFPNGSSGFEPSTLKRYEAETGVKLPKSPIAKADLLSGPARFNFYEWRADLVSGFFEELSRICVTYERQLWISTLHDRSMQSEKPTDFSNLENGIDLQRLTKSTGIRWLAGTEKSSNLPTNKGVNLQNASSDALSTSASPTIWGIHFPSQAYSWGDPTNAENFNEGQALQLAFDTRGELAGRELVQILAREDKNSICIAAWHPQIVHSQTVKKIYSSFGALPNIAMENLPITYITEDERSSLADARHNYSVVARLANAKFTQDGNTYMQLINRCGRKETLHLRVNCPMGLEAVHLLGSPNNDIEATDRTTWKVELPPFSLVCLRIDDPNFSVVQASIHVDAAQQATLDQELKSAEAVIRSAADPNQQVLLANVYGDFEAWTEDGLPFGWSGSTLPNVTIAASSQLPRSGRYSVEVRNQKLNAIQVEETSAWLLSRPFPPPRSGRLAVKAWLRNAASAPPVTTRVAIVGHTTNGEQFERSIIVGGRSSDGRRLPNDWGRRPVTLYVSDLPENATEIQIGIDLIGHGQVWIDDVEIFELKLLPDERIYLQGQLLVAKEALLDGNLLQADRFLGSAAGLYLSQFMPELQPDAAPPQAVPIENRGRAASLLDALRGRW